MSESPQHRRFQLAAAAAGFLVAAAVIVGFAFTPLRSSHDEWWHLKSGHYIAAQGLPANDIFDVTSAKIPWDNHEWVTQLLMWRVHELAEAAGWGGVRGVIALKTAFVLAAFMGFGLWLARGLRWPVAAALVCMVMAALARRTFYPRPPFVSYVFLAYLIALLSEWRAGRLRGRWLGSLPPLFALWSNMHGGWLAGLVVGGAFWLDAAWAWSTRRVLNEDAGNAARRWGAITLAGLASAAATLCNPYGWKLWLLAGRVMDDPYLMSCIGEMMPPDRNFVRVLPGAVTLAAAAALRPARAASLAGTAVVAVLAWLGWQHAPSPWFQTAMAFVILAALAARARPHGGLGQFACAFFFLYHGAHHVRQLPLAALALMPLLVSGLENWAEAITARVAARDYLTAGRRAASAPRVAAGLTLVMLAALGALGWFWLFGGRERPMNAARVAALWRGQVIQQVALDMTHAGPDSPYPSGYYMGDAYPVSEADFMLKAGLPGPVFCGGNYAGYLIWRFSPEHFKVFTDNRYDIYGGRFIRQEHAAMDGKDASYPEMLAKLAPEEYALYFSRRYDIDGNALSFEGTEPPAVPATAAGRHAIGYFTWDEVLDHWGLQSAMIPPDARLNERLKSSDRWVWVHAGLNLNIWVRMTPENAAAISRAKALDAQGR